MRHREETGVVSRLTMENMNLATRCREAISQVAALKKELAMYQKQQLISNGEYDGLKREIGVLKMQMGAGSGTSAGNALNNMGAASNGDRDIVSTNSSEGQKLQLQLATSPATELDRIMSSQKFGGSRSSSSISNTNKKPISINTTTDINDNETHDTTSSSSTPIITSNAKIPINIRNNSSSRSINDQKDDEFDADIDMVDFFIKQSSSSATTAESRQNTKSLHHHVKKTKGSVDDVMPEDMVGINEKGPLSGFSPERKKTAAGDSLLSSLDGACMLKICLV